MREHLDQINTNNSESVLKQKTRALIGLKRAQAALDSFRAEALAPLVANMDLAMRRIETQPSPSCLNFTNRHHR
jgi:hypothetical protein